MPPTDPRDGPPDADGFLDPWSQGALIRYLAWLRQAYGAVPLPPPGDAAGLTGPGVPLEEVFVQPRVSHGDAHGRSLDVFDLLDDNRHVVVLGGPGSGRSTLLSWLVHGLTDPRPNPVIDRLGRRVPVVFPIRALPLDASTRTFPALLELLADLPFWSEPLDAVLQDLCARGQALFVIDDMDLPADPSVAEALREAILDGMWRHGWCTWLMTAEPRTYTNLPMIVEGVEPHRVPPALQHLLRDRRLEVPAWHLEPWLPEQLRAYAHRWLALAHTDPGEVSERVEDFEDALHDSPRALQIADNPGLVALLAVVYAARGDIPPDRATLVDWLVAAWMAALDEAPGAEFVPPEARRSWVESLARAAEAARVAEVRRAEARGEAGATLHRHTPEVTYRRCVQLARRAVRELGHPDPGEHAAARFVQSVSVRPGILIGRGAGLGFVRADHQRFLAAIHLAADLSAAEDDSTAAEAAVSTLRSWSSAPTSHEDLVELFSFIGESSAVAERVGQRILGGPEHRSLDELSDLAPLALALQQQDADVPGPLREAARVLVEETVERWAVERQRVPPWTRDLTPVSEHVELEKLDLSGCVAVEDLTPLAGLQRLRRIDLRGCARVTDLKPLEELDALKWADLRDCTGVADISPLTRIPGLRWLDLGGCTTLHDLSSLANLGELQALVLHGCTNVTDLSPLGAARSLQYLVLTDCVGVTDLRPLEVLPGGGTVWVQGSGVRWAPPGLRWSVVGLGA